MLRPIARQRLFVPATALAEAAVSAPRAPVAWSRSSSSFPIADPAFWKTMIPKPFRRTPSPFAKMKTSRVARFRTWMAKEWNPATFFIIVFLLIGSMSINSITLKKRFEAFMRQSDVRIGLLREVVEKLQKGEKVDVERVLGTGILEQEQEWEQVLNDLEREDIARSQKKKQVEPVPQEEPENTQAKIEPVAETPSRDFF